MSLQLGLFRALFPRWNFFDQVSNEIVLDFKVSGASDWTQLPFEAQRTALGLFVNPEVTLLHAEMSFIGDFVRDLASLAAADGRVNSADVQSLITYKMVNALVVDRLKGFETNGSTYQFRISAKKESLNEVIFISDTQVIA